MKIWRTKTNGCSTAKKQRSYNLWLCKEAKKRHSLLAIPAKFFLNCLQLKRKVFFFSKKNPCCQLCHLELDREQEKLPTLSFWLVFSRRNTKWWCFLHFCDIVADSCKWITESGRGESEVASMLKIDGQNACLPIALRELKKKPTCFGQHFLLCCQNGFQEVPS